MASARAATVSVAAWTSSPRWCQQRISRWCQVGLWCHWQSSRLWLVSTWEDLSANDAARCAGCSWSRFRSIA